MTDNAMGSYSDPNITPPMGQAAPLGLQHVLAMFASNVTPSIIVAGAAGLQFGGTEQVYLIQMAMLFAGIATLFQTVGFGPVGARLPIMQGTSFAFVGVLAGIAATHELQQYQLKHQQMRSLYLALLATWLLPGQTLRFEIMLLCLRKALPFGLNILALYHQIAALLLPQQLWMELRLMRTWPRHAVIPMGLLDPLGV